MHITYDAEVDVLMVRFADDVAGAFHRSEPLAQGGAVLDLAADGTVLAMEIMGAKRRYGANALAGLPGEEDEPIALAEAATRAGVTVDALKLACRRGRLGGRKIGRNWTTTVRELETYLASRKHAGPGSAAG